MTTFNILLVEDEESLASFIQTELKFEGYQVTWANDGQKGLEFFEKNEEDYQLILLDWMLPVYDGITVARRIRRKSDVPIIMMTARNQTTDVVIGLDSGLDDYLTKPFEIEELFARIRVVARRAEKNKQAVQMLQYESIRIEVTKHKVFVHDEAVFLTPKEFGVLLELVKSAEVVQTREQLLDEVWGYDFVGQTNIVDVYVRALRNKLGYSDAGALIQTVRGVGYILRKNNEA
ncbi:two-component system response regulator [Listeria fleischmannii 1991]|uniref:Two-component system response regulator n=1 Tax=Listeria fleischmannii 1991 TaxID=1430899 RepID=A0A0J8G5M8_9LIST|nr:response regulator transcription factor [Listeria fleischmannii]EMG27407.1 OmpR family two-component response regulator [Listeria fleischmannii subsp. fleischmannii LU2006-1]KMT57885.1 two-component system response regulator [Listeria fleischmannii 1991]